MKINMANLNKQHEMIRSEIDAAIKEVIDDSQFIMGQKVLDFEEQFAIFSGAKYAIGMASGTGALHSALLALDIGKGDEVITVPFTFAATVETIYPTAAKPVFVDIESESFNIDPSLLEEKITSKTKAIMPVHLYGQMADMKPIMEIAEKHQLYVIEDAAQAHGATYFDDQAGTMGDIGTFSFYPGKNLGAMGDAGACVTNDLELNHKIRLISNHGQDTKYEHKIVGYNYRLDSIQAAILSVKLKYLSEWNSRRSEIANQYNEKLSGTGLKLPSEVEGRRHSWHQFVIRTSKRDELAEALAESGIATAIHYPIPLHLQPSFRYLGYTEGDFPVSEKCGKEVLSLPLYPELSPDDIELICSEVILSCEKLGI